MSRWKLEEEGYYLIVCPIDDKSTDNTQAKMREKAAQYGEDRINIIAHEQNKNLRGGLNTSVENFLKFGAEDDLMCLMELLYKFHLCGATFDEVGFKLRYDKKQGDSKMRVSSTMKNSLGAAIRLRKLRKKT